MKIIPIVLISLFIIVIGVGTYLNYTKDYSIDCSQPLTPFYLSYTERQYASEIADKIHGFVVIINEDGTRSLIARNEINNCIGFTDLLKYLRIN